MPPSRQQSNVAWTTSPTETKFVSQKVGRSLGGLFWRGDALMLDRARRFRHI